MNSLQTALIRANLSTIQHVVESRQYAEGRYEKLEACRKNVVRCNTAKKLKYCIGDNNA